MVNIEKGTDMNKAMQITVLVLLAAGVAFGAEAKSATMLLQEGIYAEETEGNLDKAIGIYQEAAKSAQATEKAAAEATYRTGLCYLKKGNKDAAVKQFEAVAAKYPAQKAIVEQATKQLSTLGANLDSHLPQDVLQYLESQQTKHVKEADKLNEIPTNAPIYGLDADMNLFAGGMVVYFNKTGKTLSGEINIGGTSFANAVGVESKIRVQKSNRSGGPAYEMYWTSEGNLEPNCFAIIGWGVPEGKKLFVGADGKATVAMQNMYGPECLESFYLLVPKGFKIDSPVPPTAQAELSTMDVYEWTKRVPKGANHTLNVKVAGTAEPTKPLEIGAAPWTSGEVAKLVLKTKTGVNVGELLYIPKMVQQNGKQVWQLDSYQIVPISNSIQFTRVEADGATMAPSAGRTTNQLGDFVAAYEQDKVTLSTNIKGVDTTKAIAVSGPVFDNEEALMLMRRLPLAEGYSAKFQIFPVVSGNVADCQIDVTGTEEVTVPAGTVKCWTVKLAVYSGTIKALEHTLWFSADEKKQLVKYDAGTAIMELEKVTTIAAETAIADAKTGVTMTLPDGWFGYHSENAGYATMWMFVNEGLETWSSFQAKGLQGTSDLGKAVDGDIEILKGSFENYVPRAESRQNHTVAGMPAITYTADYKDDDKAMVEYRTYTMDKTMIYWFVFRTEKDKFETNKASYDGMVNSFAVSGR
jgi:hypothetical protein